MAKTRTKLEIKKHHTLAGVTIVDLWYNDQRIASICGMDGPGIRITSEHNIEAGPLELVKSSQQTLKVIEVKVF